MNNIGITGAGLLLLFFAHTVSAWEFGEHRDLGAIAYGEACTKLNDNISNLVDAEIIPMLNSEGKQLLKDGIMQRFDWACRTFPKSSKVQTLPGRL